MCHMSLIKYYIEVARNQVLVSVVSIILVLYLYEFCVTSFPSLIPRCNPLVRKRVLSALLVVPSQESLILNQPNDHVCTMQPWLVFFVCMDIAIFHQLQFTLCSAVMYLFMCTAESTQRKQHSVVLMRGWDLAFYPGSSTEKRGGSLEDLITCLVTQCAWF